MLEEIQGLAAERIETGNEDGTCVVNLQFTGDRAAETDIRETIFIPWPAAGFLFCPWFPPEHLLRKYSWN